MVRAVILIRSPKILTSSEVRKIEGVKESLNTYGRFDAVALVEAEDLNTIKSIAMKIQAIKGVRRTETLIEVV